MDRSSRPLFLLIGFFILGYIALRILPKTIGAIFGGFLSPLYFLAFIFGTVGLLVMGFRWWLRRG